MPYTQILYQVIFSTRSREKVLNRNTRDNLFPYMAGVLKNMKSICYAINGVEDHIHIVFSLHPTVPLSVLVQKIKRAGTDLIKEEGFIKKFNGWQSGYSAFTYSNEAKENLIKYVNNQVEHHMRKTYLQELKDLYREFEIPYEDKFL